MSTTQQLLEEAQSAALTDTKRAEAIYKGILSAAATTASNHVSEERDQSLRDQETALVKLGELYRDNQYVSRPSLLLFSQSFPRNAAGLAEVITLSRSFMSSTAKAKTAKLSAYSSCHINIWMLNYLAPGQLRDNISPHPARFLQSHPQQPTDANRCAK